MERRISCAIDELKASSISWSAALPGLVGNQDGQHRNSRPPEWTSTESKGLPQNRSDRLGEALVSASSIRVKPSASWFGLLTHRDGSASIPILVPGTCVVGPPHNRGHHIRSRVRSRFS